VLAIVAAVILATKLLIQRHKNATTTPYPPGPKPLLFIGNALDFPKADAGREYVNWGIKYNSPLCFSATLQPLVLHHTAGNILHATAFGTHIIVVNSRQIADDLFENRANIYSDRPVSPVVGL